MEFFNYVSDGKVTGQLMNTLIISDGENTCFYQEIKDLLSGKGTERLGSLYETAINHFKNVIYDNIETAQHEEASKIDSVKEENELNLLISLVESMNIDSVSWKAVASSEQKKRVAAKLCLITNKLLTD